MGITKSGGLSVLLRGMPVKPLLKRYLDTAKSLNSPKRPLFSTLFDEGIFACVCMGFHRQYSEEEAKNLHRLLLAETKRSSLGDLGLLSLIMEEADEYLRWDGNQIRCKHEKIIEWQEAVRGIGQSIFISAFLAKEDYLNGKTKEQILVSPYVKTDNLRIRQMLMQGMAENHFHLKGSAPSFLLSWVCLMNHLQRRKGDFSKHEMQQNFIPFPEEDKGETLHSLVKKAAAIRLMLFRLLVQSDYDPIDDNAIMPLLRGGDIEAADLQREINKLRYSQLDSLDYVVDTQSSDSAYRALAGEHTFLYRVFRAIIARDKGIEPYLDFVYAYLLIYVRMYGEMTQSNDAVGFSNFQRYQSRKEVFLEKYPRYSDALIVMAAGSVLENNAVKSFEARIAPKPNAHKLDAAVDKTIKLCNRTFYSHCSRCHSYDKLFRHCKEKNGYCRYVTGRMFYVLHFVKNADNSLDDYKRDPLFLSVRCRHYRHRHNEVEPTVYGIAHLRQRMHKTAGYVYGLDACNQEIGCRPEVFAPYFRYARRSKVAQTNTLLHDVKVPTLRLTYHVGEDFLDVVDGLRAISETIRFLNLRHGDRLGHALALGIDVAPWYSFKHHVVLLPRQDLLDNVMWLLIAMRRYGFSNKKLEYQLNREFQNQMYAVYGKTETSVETYYDAWKLRGDYPEYYRSSKSDQSNVALNKILRGGDDQKYRRMREENSNAYALMHEYHYCPSCKEKGAETFAFDISMEYVDIVEHIQIKMREEISRLGIAIETNPSSNYLIGTFKSYHRHPLIKFYNRELVQSGDSQLFVSINTDDQGIFDTNLENEYALLACALESIKDEQGNYRYQPADVYHWLDSIRRMGMEQSFKLLENELGGFYDHE